jgi:hypothetical protein
MPEALLCLPLALILGLGLLQLGLLLWHRVLLQHAAQSAARAYTVWLPIDEAQARERAEAAATMALGPSLDGLTLTLDIQPGSTRQATAMDGGKPGVHQLTLSAQDRVPGPLGRIWTLRADTAILREDALEDATEQSN